jgi:hypothetical protein
LEANQRIYRLAGRADDTIRLTTRFTSARDIARLDPQVFADQLRDVLPADRAAEIHSKALRTSAVALAVLGDKGASCDRTAMHVLPKLDGEHIAAAAADKIPNWETLFGAFDVCACEACSSAYGPAAYFVDLLKFLGDRGVREKLFERRPDLGDIELSCENTNTVLPMIDLAIEVLENAVAPPPPFVPTTLAPALEADLVQAMASAELTAAFDPPLQPGASVEVLEAGRRWRVSDEPFAYSVVKKNDVLEVVARSRQTAGSAAERRGMPQYRNAAASDELRKAVCPWSLPFDLPTEEASVFLRHLGVSRRDLSKPCGPHPKTSIRTHP